MKLAALLVAIAAARICLAAGPAITGFVVDASGASIPGARLAAGCGSGGRQIVHTRGDGSFRIEAGGSACRIAVRHPGFGPVEVDAEPAGEPLLIALEVEGVHQQVTVSDRAAGIDIDPVANTDRVEIDAEMLDRLPIMDQDYIGALSGFLDDGMVGSAGYSLVVDGMEARDAGVSPSAIAEMKINQNPYSAEFSSPGRGRIEVTTKNGTGAFHGSFTALVRGHRLAARNAFSQTRPPERRHTFEGHLTGPIGRSGRTAFLVSGESETDNEWNLLYALTPDGLVTGQLLQPERSRELSFRLDRMVNEQRSFSMRYEFESDSSLNRGVGGFTLPEAASDERDEEHELLFSHRALIRGHVLSELRIQAGSETGRTESRVRGLPRIVVNDAFTAGGAQQDEQSRETGGGLQSVLSWSRGTHYFRAGASLDDLSRRSCVDRTDRDGVFHFSSLDDYLAGRPYSFARQAGEGRAVFWTYRVAGFAQDDWRVRRDLSFGMGLRYERHAWPSNPWLLAPRVSVAWAPGGSRNTVLRAGAGVFFDRLGSSAPRDSILYDGENLRRYLVSDPPFPPGAGAALPVSLPPEVVRLAPNLAAPLLVNYSLTVERRLWGNSTLSISWQGARGRRMFRSRDLNAPLAPLYLRPEPTVALLRQVESGGRMESHSLETSFRGNAGRFFNGGFLYSVGRARNDTGGAGWIPPDPFDLKGEWARADFDRRHRFRAFGSLEFGKLFDAGLILEASSGRPYSLTTGRDLNRDGRAVERPPGVARNTLAGPGAVTLDLRCSREFPVSGGNKGDSRMTIRIAADAFNVLNHVNYTRVVGNLASPFFGQPVAAAPARRIQLSLRLRF